MAMGTTMVPSCTDLVIWYLEISPFCNNSNPET